MKKNLKINYPKKRTRLKLEDLGEVLEPERVSMLEVLQNNLRIANRQTFLHRIIYVGEHRFVCGEDARVLFERIIIQSNETYCLEKLTGFFLYYPQYFIHMVEGDEDNLNKHLGYLLDRDAKHAFSLGILKLLIHVSHINQRFFETWVFFTGTPPKLLEKLDHNADMQISGRYIYNCIKKIYQLIGHYVEDQAAETAAETQASVKKSFDVGTLSSTESYPLSQSHVYTSQSINFAQHSLTYASYQSADKCERTSNIMEYKLFLPEYELLDFITKSNFTMKLQDYYGLYNNVPMRDIYKDRTWPVPHDFIPYDVFEKAYDCVTELPKEGRKRTVVNDSVSGLSQISGAP